MILLRSPMKLYTWFTEKKATGDGKDEDEKKKDAELSDRKKKSKDD